MDSRWDTCDFDALKETVQRGGGVQRPKTVGLTDADMAFLKQALLKGLAADVFNEDESLHAGRLIHRFGRIDK